MSVLKNFFSNFLICSPAIIISYAYYIEIINGLFFYISFILSLTLIIYFLSKQKNKIKHSKLFDFIAGKKLNEFINYIKNNNLSISELNKITYYGNITLIIYAIEKESDNIIDYLLENGYDLNFYLKNGDPPIIYCAYRGYSKSLEKLLLYKKYFDINVISKKFNANALEIAVWRGKKKIIKLLLNAGMIFSIEKYNKTLCGTSFEFKSINRDIKELLLGNIIFHKKLEFLNIHNKCVNRELSLKIFNTKPYLMENYLLNC